MANKSKKSKIPASLSLELVISVAAAAVVILILTALYSASENLSPAVGIAAALFYLASVAAAIIVPAVMRRKVAADAESLTPYIGDILTDAMINISVPSAITSDNGTVIWNNGAFQTLAGELGTGGKLRGKTLPAVLPVKWSEVSAIHAGGVSVSVKDRHFVLKNYRFLVNGQPYHMFSVYDISEIVELRRELAEERTLVAHIQIDNLNELSLYEHDEFRDASRDVDAVLRDWSNSVGGILREYEKNKYIFFFKERHIDAFVTSKFDVLDRVRQIKVGESMTPVTISIGISRDRGTLFECERASFSALDTALQRGGDQVVLHSDGNTEFYGGRQKAVQKRTKVRSRTVAVKLIPKIRAAGNVLIMGHKYPDFDSIGASIGMARFVLQEKANVHIVIDARDNNIKGVIEHVSNVPGYGDMFVDEATALDMMRSDTLVIVCDVNNFSNFAAPDVAAAANELVIIDHHIKTADPPKEADIPYIEPSASSACELIAEMHEQIYQNGCLTVAEADAMYAGILLDTKQLSRSTSPRTFSAIMYLQSCGAKPESAMEFFRADLDDYLREANFESNVKLYRDTIAIACSTEAGTAADKVAAAKVADKLLTAKGVTAVFTAVNIDGVVHISARSSGVINVQLILERLGGGGHFNVAGAQIKNAELDAALKNLKVAIDDYIKETKIDTSSLK